MSSWHLSRPRLIGLSGTCASCVHEKGLIRRLRLRIALCSLLGCVPPGRSQLRCHNSPHLLCLHHVGGCIVVAGLGSQRVGPWEAGNWGTHEIPKMRPRLHARSFLLCCGRHCWHLAEHRDIGLCGRGKREQPWSQVVLESRGHYRRLHGQAWPLRSCS